MSVFITSDLDRTLIYSQASAGTAFDGASPVCVEIYRDQPLSYMAAAAHAALAALTAHTPVIPTTTRTPEQYLRVHLPGGPHRYAICSNGGEILVNGSPDLWWQRHIRQVFAELPATLDEIVADLQARLDPAWEPRLRVVPELFTYVVSETRIPGAVVDAWRTACADRGWTVSQQGRKLYTIPGPMTKSAAAREVRRRLESDGALAPQSRWLAAGDGALDSDLLLAADAAIRPRHGELHELGFTASTLALTAGSGITAGIEIVDWLTTQTDSSVPPEIESPLHPTKGT